MATGIGQWTWHDRSRGNPDWKDITWGGWDASDEAYFGELRKYYEGHSKYSKYLGGYGDKGLFNYFGSEQSLLKPPKMPKNSGSRGFWQEGQKHRLSVADLYFYEKANPLAPPEPEPAPAPPAPEPAPEPPPIEPQPIDLS